MNECFERPAAELLCFGDAREQTNAKGEVGDPELIAPYEYDPG